MLRSARALKTYFLVFAVARLVAASAPSSASGPETAAHRIAARSFPSVFQAWNPAENLNSNGKESPLSNLEDSVATLARHDLAFVGAGGLA